MNTTTLNSSPFSDSQLATASADAGCKHHARNGRRLPVADPLTPSAPTMPCEFRTSAL